jgi:hypothetical protein
MKRYLVLGCLVVTALGVSAADVRGDINDSFFRQRREMAARQQNSGYAIVKRPWGGPTTSMNWWTTERVPVGNSHHGHSGWHGVPGGSSSVNFNYYYFAPFSYPTIQNNYGFSYGYGY